MAQIVTWGGLKKSHGEWADQVSWRNGLKRSHGGWDQKVTWWMGSKTKMFYEGGGTQKVT